jgi:hypothetical protein
MTEVAAMTGEQIEAKVRAKLDEYKGRSVLEQYALFMGKAQILEFGLKGLLTRKFNVPDEDMERWTLGKTKNELRDRGLRPDFIAFLDSVVNHRNNMAHEFLANVEVTRSIGDFSARKLYGDLFHAIYELEQIIILHDWCEENDGWLPRA